MVSSMASTSILLRPTGNALCLTCTFDQRGLRVGSITANGQ